jgi:L-lysine 6-transaminase
MATCFLKRRAQLIHWPGWKDIVMPATASVRKPNAKTTRAALTPEGVIAELEKHILVDGFKLVFDLEKSHGSYFVDAATSRELIDLYSFYASQPIGFNHPHFDKPEVQAELLAAAKIKVANADVYTVQFAEFVKTFARVAAHKKLNRFFFIEGGAAAVENTLKTAMDWKVRKNMAAGRGERGTEIIHFEKAFHGRSGYTMSLTNTDPRKIAYFAKFPWPRIPGPALDFSLPPFQREKAVIEKEKRSESMIREIFERKGADIAAIIIEPIQGEGGDNHFRGEFLKTLRRLCDEHEALLIFDEVQCGMGITGKTWAWEHFDVAPDLMAFGKKVQVCGVLAGSRVDEVPDNCFRLPSRINSTWGGNFTDYVRSTHYLRIIEQEKLIENARTKGEYFTKELHTMAKKFPVVSAVRGRGLMLAFDLPNTAMRDQFWKGAYELGLLVVRCGERSIRLRPVLDVKADVIDEAVGIMHQECRRLS